MNKIITEDQHNIQDEQDFLLTDVNLVNLKESLQSSSIENAPKRQGKHHQSDKKIEKIATSKNDLQNFGKKDVTEFRKCIQNLQREFNRLCSLISDLLNILHPKVSPKLLNQVQIKKIST